MEKTAGKVYIALEKGLAADLRALNTKLWYFATNRG